MFYSVMKRNIKLTVKPLQEKIISLQKERNVTFQRAYNLKALIVELMGDTSYVKEIPLKSVMLKQKKNMKRG